MKRKAPCPLSLLAPLALVAACEPLPLDETAPPFEGAAEVPDCRPDNDGVIERPELPFVAGVIARYRVAEGPVAVEPAGRLDDTGTRVWDLSVPKPDAEPLARLAAERMEGHWFEPSFPGVELAGPLDARASLLGPLSVDDEGVHLHGAASKEPQPEEGETLLVYDEPITLYPFPLAEGAHVVTEGRATNGTLLGLPVALLDRYDVEVTARGTLRLPDLILENTLRVTLRLERTLVVGDARQVTHVFVHECLGEVARMTSEAVPLDEPLDDDFDTAAQVWRLSL